MPFLTPFLATIFQTGSLLTDKTLLGLKKITFKTYVGVSFPLIFLVNLIIFLVVRPPFSVELFFGINGVLILVATGISIVSNILLYRGLERDNLGEIETVDLFQQIPIIILSSLLFSDERNLFVIIPAIIAAVAIIWSHWEHHHFKIAKKTWPYFLWVITAEPINVALCKILLQSWDPLTFSFVRSGLRAIVFIIMYGKHVHNISAKGWALFLLTNILTSVAWILFFTSYQHSGVVFTTLLICLQPLLVYAGSLFVLKEKFHWKKAVAFMVILACIVPSQFLK